MKKRVSVTHCREIIIMSEANNKVLRFCPNFNSAAKSRGSYIPDFTLPPEDDTRPIGVWGMRHKDYLKNHRKAIYSIMLMDNTLHSYLADINEHAEDMFFRLVKDMAKSEGITEQLKAENQMLWVQEMNNIRNRAIPVLQRIFEKAQNSFFGWFVLHC